jgi:hypothetical protein
MYADGQAMPSKFMLICVICSKRERRYQGENNCNMDVVGSSLDGTGYGCELPAMVADWRAGDNDQDACSIQTDV